MKKFYLGVLLFFCSSPAFKSIAQNVNATWGANSNTAWYTLANWAGGAYAGAQGAANINSNIATFSSAFTGTTVGINMGTASLNLGAISLDNTRNTLVNVGNSSGTAGVLRLYGATVNSIPNVIIRNSSVGMLTLQGSQTGTMGVVLSGTDNIINLDNSGSVTISSILSGTGNLLKAGSGTGILTLTGVNTYSGTTRVTTGELRVNPSADNLLTGAFNFNGGTFSTNGISSSRAVTFGSIDLSENSTLALGANAHSLTFTNSGTIAADKTLMITGWAGTAGISGTAGKVFVGNSASILSAAQKARIQFSGYPLGQVTQLSTGEIVPAALPTYTVIYNGNTNTGGSVPIDAGSPYVSGATVTVLGNSGSLVKTGFNFAGWNTAANGSGTSYTPGLTFSMPAANTTLYAQWTASTNPNLAITGTPTNHGAVCPLTAATTVTYTITNSGGVQADGVTVVSNNPEFVVTGLSSATIAIGATSTFQVTFTPASAGAKTATITVASTTAGSNAPTSSLTGTGNTPITQAITTTAATGVSYSTASLNGNVTTLGVCPASTQKGFVYSITATNGTPMVGGTGVNQVAVGAISTGTFANALAGLASSTQYSFQAYVYNGSTYNYGGVFTFTTLNALVLSGTLAHVSSCPGASVAPQTYTITNNSIASVTGITVTSANTEFVISALSSTSVAAGGTATYQVTFTPAAAGARSALITVVSPNATTVTNTVTGTGISSVAQAVTSAAATLITGTTASINGNVITVGICPATIEKGFVYSMTSTNANPLDGGTGVTKTSVGSVATGAFTLGLTGLPNGTGYSFRSYVYDGTTYTYGAVATFNTLTPPVNDLCANATSLVVGAASTAGTLVDAAPQPGFSEKDVWYTFTPTCAGSHTITLANIVGATDIDFKVYSSNCPATSGVSALYSQTAGSLGVTEINTNNYLVGTTYYIRAYIFNNASPETGFTIQVAGNAPATPLPFTAGSASPCVGASQTYTVSTVSNAASYTWTLPSGWSGSSTTNSITVIPTATGGNVSVTANNCYGSKTAQTVVVTPIPIPLTPGSITGNTPVCSGSAQNYFISPVADATSYTWTLPDGTWSGTSTTESINAVAGATGGNITVRASNSCGSSPAQSFPVAVLASVTAPSAVAGTAIGSNIFTANWNSVAGATGYYVDVYTLTAAPTDLFISEYVEGSSNNKYIEIFNGTGAAVSLNDYRLRLYTNGLGTTSSDVQLSGTLNNNSTIVYRNSGATIYGAAATNSTAVDFNGNDAVVLYKMSTLSNVDIIGRIGEDPGVAWTSGSFSTVNKTLVRKSSVYAGVSTNPPTGFPTLGIEWNQSNQDVVSNLGAHSFLGGLNYVAGYQNVYTTDLFLNVAGVNPSTVYYYVVRADNSNCVSSNSNQISVTTASACVVGTQSITSFLPSTGPVGTRVTITGTGFTGVTGIKFGSVDVISYSIVNSTTIVAQLPLNAVTSKIKISFASSCSIESASNFTLINNNGSCGGGAGVATDLFISEVYDALNGSLGYIELFNGTNGAINLSNYKIRFNTGAITTTNLTGSIAAGATFLLRIGTGTICGSVTANQNSPSTSGFNENDDIDLLKDGVVIDHLVTINDVGFSMVRNAAATVPSVSYIPGDWTTSTTESCSSLGASTFVSASSITITTQPTDEIDCSAISFTVTATSIAPPPNYLWKYLNPLTNSWENASGITSATLGVTAAGTITQTLTLTGNTAHLQDYQFYCELEEGSCTQATHAVQYNYPTRTAYRSKNTGNWSSPINWEMTNTPAVAGSWINACQYPNAQNSDEITILGGHTITLDVDNFVDKLTVDAGATLTNNSTNRLSVNNAVTNADFIVNGTYQDNSGSANTFSLSTGATWQLGTNATIIKTNLGGGADYRDFYEGGIATIPATANWIYRHNSAAGVNFVGSTGTIAMYYPNLVLENTQTGTYQSSVNTSSPQLSVFTMYGPSNPIIIKGSLDVGGIGSGTVNISNISSNANVRVDGNLTIKVGNTLTLAAADATNTGKGFEVRGNLVTNGILVCTVGSTPTGELVFSGTTAQSISGTGTMNLEDVNINNTGAGMVTLNKNIDIPGTLDFGNAAAKLTLGTGNITLKSTSARTANVGVIPAGASINYTTSKFIVERYLLAGRKWRFLSVPTINAAQSILSSWQENRTTANTYGFQAADPRADFFSRGFELRGYNSSVKKFNDVSNAWEAVDYTNTFDMNSQRGYMVFVPGDRTVVYPSGGATTLRTSGAINKGTISTINVPAGKFAIIGNPYASRIDIRNIGFTNSGVEQSVAVWDPTITGSYGLGGWNYLYRPDPDVNEYVNQFNSGIYGIADRSNNFIESGMAFFVRSTTNGSVVLTENSKTVGSQVSAFTSGLRQGMNISLRLANGTLLDGAKAQYGNEFSNAIDGYDIHKLHNLGEEVSLKSADSTIVIERRAMIQRTDTLHLHMSRMKFQDYQWEIVSDNLDYPGRSGFLIDRYKNTSTELSMTAATNHNFTVENIAGSYAADRFIIVFNQPEPAPVPMTITTVSAIRKEDRSILVDWAVENELNVQQYEVLRGPDSIQFASIYNRVGVANNGGTATYAYTDIRPLPVDNYYRIKATSVDGSVQYSSIVRVTNKKQLPFASVHPNPVEGKKIHIRFAGQAAGSYQVQLTNGAGLLIYQGSVSISNAIQVQQITLPANTAAGIYQLSVGSPDGYVEKLMLTIL